MGTRIRVGCQSWGYDDWVTHADGHTIFYPRGTRSAEMLELYSSVFDTIEVDSTAYGTPAASTLEGWTAKTPGDFIFSVKVPRRITHDFPVQPLIYPEIDEFLERASELGDKLGVVLFQFPAAFESTKENAALLRAFLEHLPKGPRFAIEFRHSGWFVDWTFEELAERSIALAMVDGKWVERETMFAALPKVTRDHIYVRFMGTRDLESFDRIQRPQDQILETWCERLRDLDVGEIFIYVDNYFEGFAPGTANKIKRLLDLSPRDPQLLEAQPSLF